MRTRFKKVWCGSCATMQFAGECPHGRVEEAVDSVAHGFTARDNRIKVGLELAEPLDDEPVRRRRDPHCSCRGCCVGAPCEGLAGA